GHDLDGTRKPVLVIALVAVYEKQDGGHTNHNEGKQAHQNDGAVNLGTNAELPVLLEQRPAHSAPDQQGNKTIKSQQRQEGTEQVSEQSNGLDSTVVLACNHNTFIGRWTIPQFFIPIFLTHNLELLVRRYRVHFYMRGKCIVVVIAHQVSHAVV